MLDDAVGRLSKAEEFARVTLADAAAFRTWCGASTQAEALARVHPQALPGPNANREHTIEELQTARPFVILNHDPEPGGYSREMTAIDGAGYNSIDSGRIMVEFQQDVPPKRKNDSQAVLRAATNSMGTMLDDVFALAGMGDYLDIRRIQVAGPWRNAFNKQATQGDFLLWTWVLVWGRLS